MQNVDPDSSNPRNSYMEEVLQQQQEVVQQLKKSRSAPAPAAPIAMRAAGGAPTTPGNAIEVRITGYWAFKTVIVPPNVYVVHTRRGQAEPVTLGLGISFRYNPYTDAFLVIPAVMQTIVINARCICRQRQGILVQAYVQWIVDDVRTAYRKLDFSDPVDPMQVVNVQLREQAEAAIKDKVAILDIDDVLADKQPIIEELTHRLRSVAEGKEGDGLGLKIVTVQIKEAVVSSTRLWQNLQAPFRAEQARIAELAQIQNEREILTQKIAHRKETELSELAIKQEIEALRHSQQVETFDRQHSERSRQLQLQQQAEQQKLREEAATRAVKEQQELAFELTMAQHAHQRHQARIAELEALKAVDIAEAHRQQLQQERALALAAASHRASLEQQRQELEIERLKREIENTVSEGRLQERLLEHLPELAARMPVPQHSEQIVIQGAGAENGPLLGLGAFLKQAWSLLQKIGEKS